jgi:hypothetical protein
MCGGRDGVSVSCVGNFEFVLNVERDLGGVFLLGDGGGDIL